MENQTFFIKSLDDYSTKYLKNPNQQVDQVKAIIEHEYLKNKISEFLMLYDKISLKVYGENVPLMLLINWFGADGVLELFKQNALEFVLWNNIITYMLPDNGIEGINPFQSGHLTSDVHRIPRISAKEGFKWIKGENRPSKKVQKKIIQQVKKNTIVPPEDLSSNVLSQLKFYREEYQPKNHELSLNERKEFASMGSESIELSIASQQGYSFGMKKINGNY